MYIESYNNNTYVNILKLVYEGLIDIQSLLNEIEEKSDFKNIEDVVELYKRIFENNLISNHIICDMKKIYKLPYLINPETHTKGNSYWHINLSIKSNELKWLDKIYGLQLTKLIKLYKHTFSKIDDFLITFKTKQISKYQSIIDVVIDEIETFLEFINNRDVINRKEKLNEQQLTKIPFGALFYTAHIRNIESILELGIVSHNLAHSQGLVTEDISNRQVNERRNRIIKSIGGNIHDFTPLYFNPRNPMFYVLCKQKPKKDLVLIRVNPHILMEDNVCFSDGNAASRSTLFYKNLDDFNKLNWEVIKDEYWTNHLDGKRVRCSEVLVREKIPMYYITDIYAYNQNALEKILPLFPNHLGINLKIDNCLYF